MRVCDRVVSCRQCYLEGSIEGNKTPLSPRLVFFALTMGVHTPSAWIPPVSLSQVMMLTGTMLGDLKASSGWYHARKILYDTAQILC